MIELHREIGAHAASTGVDVLVAVGPLLTWRKGARPIGKRLTVPALFAATALVNVWPALLD